jgi:hypothetical protein
MTGRRPRMTRTRNTPRATTSRTWMKPPIVYDDPIPSNHITIRIRAIVESI